MEVVWEAAAEAETTASAEAVWGLWADPACWPQWNPRIAGAELETPFVAGGRARIRFKRSPRPLRFTITRLEPRRLFVDETRMPGVTMGHEHRLEERDGRTIIQNRLYMHGPAERLWVALLGRGMRSAVRRFVQLERQLAEAQGGRAAPVPEGETPDALTRS